MVVAKKNIIEKIAVGKKKQFCIFNGSKVINFLMKPCNPAFLRKRHWSKTMTDKYVFTKGHPKLKI
jgi:hypothetical protein